MVFQNVIQLKRRPYASCLYKIFEKVDSSVAPKQGLNELS